MADLTLDEALVKIVQRAAKSVAYQWPGVIDRDDIEQSIYVHLLERPNSIEKIRDMEERARYRAIIGIGHQIASAERTDYDHFKGSYNYSVAEVKDLLKMGILTDPPPNFRAELIDMEDALHDMEKRVPQYVEAIRSRYEDHEVPPQGAAAQRLSTALGSLADEMNKVSRRRFSERDDGPGTREVISNAQAQYISNRQYSGDGEVDY